jgi:hypothetical protein
VRTSRSDSEPVDIPPSRFVHPIVQATVGARHVAQTRAESADSEARYRLRAIAGKPEEGSLEEASGAYWMSRGIDLHLAGDFQAAAIVFDRVASAN